MAHPLQLVKMGFIERLRIYIYVKQPISAAGLTPARHAALWAPNRGAQEAKGEEGLKIKGFARLSDRLACVLSAFRDAGIYVFGKNSLTLR
jgi:hypothetical protein